MENKEKSPLDLFKEVNKIDIVDYLATQNIHPKRETGGKAIYHSPIRDGDSTPSFVVYKNSNTWYDWGLGKGSTMVDLGMELFKISAVDFVRRFESPGQREIAPRRNHEKAADDYEVKVLEVKDITSYPLLKYLDYRKIPTDIGREIYKEVRFTIKSEQYALGFKNDAGGYELRSAVSKVSSMPKDSTFINNGSSILNVIEGSFSYASIRTLLTCLNEPLPNFLILNGTGFFEKKLDLMRAHNAVDLCLDHGKGGRKFTAIGLQVDNNKFHDRSSFYKGHDDPNDWWVADGHKIYLPHRRTEQDRNTISIKR